MDVKYTLKLEPVDHLLNANDKPLLEIKKYQQIARKFMAKLPITYEAINLVDRSDLEDYIVDALIRADVDWTVGRGTITGFRKQSVKWALGRLNNRIVNYGGIHIEKSLDSKITSPNRMRQVFYSDLVKDEKSIPVELVFEKKDDVKQIFAVMIKKGFSKVSIAILYSYFLESLTLEEVAARYGCSKQNVQQTLQRTLARLKAILSNGKEYPTRPSNRSTG